MIPYSEFILLSIVISQFIIGYFNKKCHERREDQLINAILSKNLPEYTQSLETPKDRIKQMNAESKLAEEATKLEREMRNTDVIDSYPSGATPVT